MYLLIKNKNYSNSQYFLIQGFTLIEVMITLVIVALLSSLAIPWYGDYTRKTYVAESISLASSARSQTVELIAMGQIQSEGIPPRAQWAAPGPGMPMPVDTSSEIFVESPNPFINRIMRVGSVVVIGYTTKMDPKGETQYSLVYYSAFVKTTGSVQWKCLISPAADEYIQQARAYYSGFGPALPARWAPKNCSDSLY